MNSESPLVYIAAIDSDSFNYAPKQESRNRVESHNKNNPDDTLEIYETYEDCAAACDYLNSL